MIESMLILVVGFRQGLVKSLEEMGLPFLIWNQNPIKSKTLAQKLIFKVYPKSQEEFETQISSKHKITHIIAGTEDAVVVSSKIRQWTGARSNPHSLIIRCTDKLIMKQYLKEKNIPMTKFIAPPEPQKLKVKTKVLGESIVVKPRKSSGGRGLSIIDQSEIDKAKILKDSILEEKIIGTEGSVESFVINNEIVFSNVTEYLKNGFCNLVPCSYSSKTIDNILALNKKVIKALKIKWGMTHLEFYITKEKILFGEIALRPPGGYIMEALGLAYGLDFWTLFAKTELGLDVQFQKTRDHYAAVMVIHPGSGVVDKIEGLEEIKELESLKKFKLKLKLGSKIEAREGVGQDYGYAFLCDKDQKKLISDLKLFNKKLKVAHKAADNN